MKTYTTRVHGMQVAVVRSHDKQSPVFFKTFKLAIAYAGATYPQGGSIIALTQVAAGTQVFRA